MSGASGSPSNLTPATRLGPYEVTAPLGAGGMGEVYRARDTRLERDVAVKLLPPHLASSALNHPHIATLHDVGSASVKGEELHYMVMELVEGRVARRAAREGTAAAPRSPAARRADRLHP
jgi:serine/threonine protein kinase